MKAPGDVGSVIYWSNWDVSVLGCIFGHFSEAIMETHCGRKTFFLYLLLQNYWSNALRIPWNIIGN